MPTPIKPEEILPENFEKLKETGSDLHIAIMLQTVISFLLEKNIATAKEINERAKQLYEVQREMLIAELKK